MAEEYDWTENIGLTKFVAVINVCCIINKFWFGNVVTLTFEQSALTLFVDVSVLGLTLRV